MLRFNTRRGLRRAVERNYGHALSDDTWAMLEPDFEPSYSDYDVEDILKGIRDYKPKERRKKNVVKAIQKSVPDTSRPFNPAIANRSKFRYYREHVLGLKEPITIEEVRKTLEELSGSIETPGTFWFVPIPEKFYSMTIADGRKIDVWEVGIYPVHEKWNDKCNFVEMVLSNSQMFGCHPACMVAFILCDILPKFYHLPMIIRHQSEFISGQRERNRMVIEIPNPEISTKTVSKAYVAAREAQIKEKRKILGKRARPRSQTERVDKLMTFAENYTELGWRDLFKKWNETYPRWTYGSVHSMQVIYYRALKKLIL